MLDTREAGSTFFFGSSLQLKSRGVGMLEHRVDATWSIDLRNVLRPGGPDTGDSVLLLNTLYK